MKEQEEKNWLEKITLAGDFETPFLLTDLAIARDRARLLGELLPRVEIYYATKSNNDPQLLRALDPLVAGYDIASAGEYRQLIELGIDPSRLLYSNPVKVPSHIEETYKGGVQCFAVDSLPEVAKLKKYAPGSVVNLRLKTPDYGSRFPLSSKFGIDAAHAVDYASLAEDAGLHVRGLTFHVGSQSENAMSWEVAIKMCANLIDALAEKGIKIEFLDLGGGLPATYEDIAPTVVEAAETINKALDEYISKDIRIVIEPGRYISANSSVLVTSVIGREHRTGTDWLYVDMGVFQGLIEPLEIPGWKYPIFTDKSRSGYKKSFVLTGPTCDAYDTIGADYMLPSDMNVGDRVYIGATGAYSLVYGSKFNGFEVPKTYYINKDEE
jgi:ornithine decarboxylase